MRYIRYLLLFMSIFLTACNDGTNKNVTEPELPVINIEKPVVHDSIDKVFTNNQLNEYKIDLSKHIYETNGLPLDVYEYSTVGDDCKVSINKLNLLVSSKGNAVCTIYYKVRNLPDDMINSKFSDGVSSVVFSSTQAPYLPTINKSSSFNKIININIKDELGAFFPNRGKLSEKFWSTQSSSEIELNSSNNSFIIHASDKSEVIQLRYSIDTSENDVKFGMITVTISESNNLSPNAKSEYFEVDSSDSNITFDVTDLISDPDDDVESLQLLKVDSFDNVAKIIDIENLSNKKFDINIDKPGLYDINYIVTDHHGGYASSLVRINVKMKKYWDDIKISSGVVYTAPWEQVGADLYGLPYQNLIDYSLDGKLFHIPLFNYESAEAVCRLRGMVIPTIQQLLELYADRGDVQTSDNWPNDEIFWSSSDDTVLNTKMGLNLKDGKLALELDKSKPNSLTCVLPGTLSVNIIRNDQYTTNDPLSDSYDELEATVYDLTGSGLADSIVYIYSNNQKVMFEKQIGTTNSEGKAFFKVRSPSSGLQPVIVSYYSQNLKSDLNFILDEIANFDVQPDKYELEVDGESLKPTAQLNYKSGEVVDVSEKTTYREVPTAEFVKINGNEIIGIKEGTAIVEGTFMDDPSFTDMILVTVTDPIVKIDASPDSKTINIDDSLQMSLKATYKSGLEKDVPPSDVQWSSEESKVANVDTNGIVKGLSEGSTSIKASYMDLHDASSINVINSNPIVGVKISPKYSSISINDTTQMELSLVYQNGNSEPIAANDVKWESSALNIASVANNGVVTGKSEGNVIITGEYNGMSDNAVIDVGDPIISVKVSPDGNTIDINQHLQLSLTATYLSGISKPINSADVSWVSFSPDKVGIDTRGLATGISEGTSNIQGTYSGKSDIVTINVKSALKTLEITGPDKIIIDYTSALPDTIKLESIYNGSQNVSTESQWSSDNLEIATVDNSGTVTGIQNGSAIITAKYNGLTATHTVQVLRSDYGDYAPNYKKYTECEAIEFTGGPAKIHRVWEDYDPDVGIPVEPKTTRDIVCKPKLFSGLAKAKIFNLKFGQGLYDVTAGMGPGLQGAVPYNMVIDDDSKDILEMIEADAGCSGFSSSGEPIGCTATPEAAGNFDGTTWRLIAGYKCVKRGEAHLTSLTGKKMVLKCI
ncbi:TPA: Ig-like domain-containing protein [Photobacterium damselae]